MMTTINMHRTTWSVKDCFRILVLLYFLRRRLDSMAVVIVFPMVDFRITNALEFRPEMKYTYSYRKLNVYYKLYLV